MIEDDINVEIDVNHIGNPEWLYLLSKKVDKPLYNNIDNLVVITSGSTFITSSYNISSSFTPSERFIFT